MFDFKLPEVGENIESGNIVSIAVSVGDTVSKDQDLFELETDKASLPVPSPVAGEIKEILIKTGDDVKIGQVVMKIQETATADQTDKKPQPIQKTQSRPNRRETPAEQQRTSEPTHSSPAQSDIDPKDINLVVIGGGPGGYAAAFLAADLGMNVTLVNKEKEIGGVCLNRGCIPSKALLHAAKVLSEAREAKEFGIEFGVPKIHLDQLRNWKNSVISKLTGGLAQMAKQRKVNILNGCSKFVDSNTIEVGNKKISFDKAIIATGSSPIELPFAPDSKDVLDSTSALDIESVPESMLLIGGGYIGLELGIVYAELGTEVSVVEMLPQLMAGADRDLVNIVKKRLDTIMKNIMLETKVKAMDKGKEGITVTFEDKDGKEFTESFSKVLVAVGRRPNSKDIGLDKTDAKIDEQGFVEVNAQRRTDDPNIYAIGDVAGNPMLAHKASHEGRVAVEAIAGERVAFEPACIPAVVFTDPEIAWAGLTEEEAKAAGTKVDVQKFPWAASGRAISLNRVDGLTKIIIDPESERILGVAIVGTGAGEMIAEGVLAIEMGANATDLKLSIHPHPTLTETVMEAAEMFYGQSTHIYRPKNK